MGNSRHTGTDKAYRVSPGLISRDVRTTDYKWLYDLLATRPAIENISHEEMPDYKNHKKYWDRIRKHWQTGIICINGHTEIPIGYWYITDRSEVGIHIDPRYKKTDYEYEVLKWIVRTNNKPLYANLAYKNYIKKAVFARMGFTLLQHTYRLY